MVNVNVANANNNVNNENAAMAGRRRRKKLNGKDETIMPPTVAPGVIVQQLQPLPQPKNLNKDLDKVVIRLPGKLYAVQKIKIGYIAENGNELPDDTRSSKHTLSVKTGRINEGHKWLKQLSKLKAPMVKTMTDKAASIFKASKDWLTTFTRTKRSSKTENHLPTIAAMDASTVGLVFIDTYPRIMNDACRKDCVIAHFCNIVRAVKSHGLNPLTKKLTWAMTKKAAIMSEKYTRMASESIMEMVKKFIQVEHLTCDNLENMACTNNNKI